MFELIGWNVGMSAFAAILLVAGALFIGVAAHLIGDVAVNWEWAATGIGALVGGYLSSEPSGASARGRSRSKGYTSFPPSLAVWCSQG